MANKKSSKKDIRRTLKRKTRNTAVKSALKTFTKKTRLAIVSGEETNVTAALTAVISKLDKAVQKGVIHKNAAARRKSRLAKAVNKAKAAKEAPATPA